MSDNPADPLIAELGARMGMAGLRLGAAGTCQLVFDQRWVVTVIADSHRNRFLLNCPLCTPQQMDQLPAAVLRTLLEANFMGRGMGGPQLSLSIAPDRRAYLQFQLFWQEAAHGGLHNALELLLNQAETWAARLAQPPSGGAALESLVARSASAPDWSFQRV